MPTYVRLVSALVMAAVAAIFCLRVFYLLKAYWLWEFQFLTLIPLYCLITAFFAFLFLAKSADVLVRSISECLTLMVGLVLFAILAHALGMVLIQSMTDRYFDAAQFGTYLLSNLSEIALFLLEPLLIFILAGGAVVAGFIIHKAAQLRS